MLEADSNRDAELRGAMTDAATGILASLLSRTLVLLGVWLCLTRGDLTGIFGPTAAVAAALLSLRMLSPADRPLCLHRAAGLLPRFVRHPLVVGLDVARRTASRRPDRAPDMPELRLSLGSEGERVLLANIVTLLPGTLAADLDEHRPIVDALDRREDIAGQVRELQAGIRSLCWTRSKRP